MVTREIWDGHCIPALGLGCWAIGGPCTANGTAVGWGAIDDAESLRAIDCAVDLGIRFFDTAPSLWCRPFRRNPWQGIGEAS